MIVYEVRYRDNLLGHLHIDNGLHRYIPCAEMVETLCHQVFLLREMTSDYPWGKPIPFFEKMIQDNMKAGRKEVLYFQNNNYVMRLVSAENRT